MNAGVKALPVADLALVAVVYQCGEFESDGGLRAEFDIDILDEAAYERAGRPANIGKRMHCDCCGQRLKYACLLEHRPTREFYNIGRQCANKIESLRRFGPRVEQLSVALAERAACNARQTEWVKANDGEAVVVWAKTGVNRTAEDLLAKLRQYGLSDKQTEFLKKLHADDVALRAKATGTAPTGKQAITGTVVSVKLQFVPPYGRWGTGHHIAKVLVQLDNGAKVYGNAPGSTVKEYAVGTQPACSVEKGQRVSFKAAFEPSERDPLFGFWKRPQDWQLDNQTAPK